MWLLPVSAENPAYGSTKDIFLWNIASPPYDRDRAPRGIPGGVISANGDDGTAHQQWNFRRPIGSPQRRSRCARGTGPADGGNPYVIGSGSGSSAKANGWKTRSFPARRSAV